MKKINSMEELVHYTDRYMKTHQRLWELAHDGMVFANEQLRQCGIKSRELKSGDAALQIEYCDRTIHVRFESEQHGGVLSGVIILELLRGNSVLPIEKYYFANDGTIKGFVNHEDDAIYVDKNLRDVIMLALAFDVLGHVN
ncbi:MAG: hypothetical protein GYB30_05705 [Gammaproteobacteria bacterium]|nr:hypothetical protein [Gammaproteobacteria bacterium]